MTPERDARYSQVLQEVETAVRNPAVYRAAADLVRTKGHTREVFAATAPHDQGGQVCNIEAPEAACFCIMGALVRAGVDLDLLHPQASLSRLVADWTDGDAYGFAMMSEATQIMDLPQRANAWNNHKDRTAEEVIAALEAGAAALEDEGD
ncbi:hypothetical protein MARCHEWKA_03330 [Brevundimonas phage vB_BpoS-Marchewka]|uniref:Uncharacterized protein n=1 Tax=Brevundimonas phage vB_BpoS-Marchewka TaxID=2948604 RepID=A0A9E7N4D9_9CAUD|nr:hypothetical protein MARCHEWKA_03330 [Brevundimonas phage vB_BpoS-Marchewka]